VLALVKSAPLEEKAPVTQSASLNAPATPPPPEGDAAVLARLGKLRVTPAGGGDESVTLTIVEIV